MIQSHWTEFDTIWTLVTLRVNINTYLTTTSLTREIPLSLRQFDNRFLLYIILFYINFQITALKLLIYL